MVILRKNAPFCTTTPTGCLSLPGVIETFPVFVSNVTQFRVNKKPTVVVRALSHGPTMAIAMLNLR